MASFNTFRTVSRNSELAAAQLADATELLAAEARNIADRLTLAVTYGESGDLDRAKSMVEACIRDIRGAVSS